MRAEFRRRPVLLLASTLVACGAVLATLAVGGPAHASSETRPADCLQQLNIEALPASACPLVFGTVQARQSNETHRKEALETVEEGEYCIDLVHSVGWEQPAPVSYDSLELRDVTRPEGCPPIALVELDPEGTEIGCEPGTYALQVDDSLGHGAQVLAILDKVVLLEAEDELRYLRITASEQPVWRLTWQSPWRYKVPKASSSSSGKAKKKARGKKKKKKKRKKPKKRKR